MNVFALVETQIAEALAALKSEGFFPDDLVLPAVEAEVPRDASHGDVASNIAMVLAKPAKSKPRDIADAIKGKLEGGADIEAVSVAGPGFLNVKLTPGFWQKLVAGILKDGAAFGKPQQTDATKVNVEYVSANPTGPMHVGHCRGAVFGDALANLLAFVGYDVAREYYVNDAGGQVDVLARSAHMRYREALGHDIGAIPEGLYPGDYLKPVGAALAKAHGSDFVDKPESDWLDVFRSAAIDAMMDMIRNDLAALNIRHDVFFSEASLTANGKDGVKAAVDRLADKGLIYKGTLDRPKGHEGDDWEDREQTLFKSTQFGDDEDRAIQKSDGSYTYFAGDIAYHLNKLERGFLHLINVFGADHIGYISRMKSAVSALSDGKADLDIKVCQLVRLLRDGKPVKMGKRLGTFVTLRDVVDEVGRDPVRFMMLYRKNDASLDFDFAKVTEQSRDNPVFYVQYAHARAASVFRRAHETFPALTADSKAVREGDLSQLQDPADLALIKRLAFFPKLVQGAAKAHEPHRVAFYLYDLASEFHGLWTRGNDLPQLRFIHEDDESLTAARLALVAATQTVLSAGLGVLGVEAPEVMR